MSSVLDVPSLGSPNGIYIELPDRQLNLTYGSDLWKRSGLESADLEVETMRVEADGLLREWGERSCRLRVKFFI